MNTVTFLVRIYREELKQCAGVKGGYSMGNNVSIHQGEAPCEHTDQVAAVCRTADLCYWREGSDHIQSQAGVKTSPKLENWFRTWNSVEL